MSAIPMQQYPGQYKTPFPSDGSQSMPETTNDPYGGGIPYIPPLVNPGLPGGGGCFPGGGGGGFGGGFGDLFGGGFGGGFGGMLGRVGDLLNGGCFGTGGAPGGGFGDLLGGLGGLLGGGSSGGSTQNLPGSGSDPFGGGIPFVPPAVAQAATGVGGAVNSLFGDAWNSGGAAFSSAAQSAAGSVFDWI